MLHGQLLNGSKGHKALELVKHDLGPNALIRGRNLKLEGPAAFKGFVHTACMVAGRKDNTLESLQLIQKQRNEGRFGLVYTPTASRTLVKKAIAFRSDVYGRDGALGASGIVMAR